MPKKKTITLYTEDDLMQLSVSELLDLYQNSIEVVKTIEGIIKPIKGNTNTTSSYSFGVKSPKETTVDPSGLFPVYQNNSVEEVEALNKAKASSNPSVKSNATKINMGNEVVEFLDVSDPSYMDKSFKKNNQSMINNLGAPPTFSQNKKIDSSSPLETPTVETVEDVKLRKTKRASKESTVDSNPEAE